MTHRPFRSYTYKMPRRKTDYNSDWVVERRVEDLGEGRTRLWRLQFTACGKMSCRRCGATEPAHGPYWYWREEIDARNNWRYHGRERPWPEGLEPPPLLPSEDDPESRRNVRRRAAAAALDAAARTKRSSPAT